MIIRTQYSFKREEWMVITPELAKFFLSCSPGNRPETAATVNAYARDMKANHWCENGEPICFDWNGKLRNGHHRCLACVKSGVPFKSLVAFGLDPAQCDEYDRGRARSFRDKMILARSEKWASSGTTISVVRAHFRNIKIDKPTDSELYDFLYRNEEDLKWCYTTFLYKAKKNTKKAPVALALFYAKKLGVNKEEIKDFAESVETGLYDINKGTAVYRFLKDLNSSSGLLYGRPSQNILLHATENALKDYLNRKDRTKTYLTHQNPVWSALPSVATL